MDSFESMMFQYLDRFKVLFFPEQWDNLILNCSKNELFILLYIYRNGEVNMTMIADYINAPLNTLTGIVTRMEKRELIKRERSAEDKRVVTVRMDEKGSAMIEKAISEFVTYGQKVMEGLTPEETGVLLKVIDKVTDMLQQEQVVEPIVQSTRVKRITIE